jgi:tRNA A37 methylthiotransferase MiaB
VKQAISEGVSEIWLTSEDTGAYGLDINTNIAELLEKLSNALPPKVTRKQTQGDSQASKLNFHSNRFLRKY